MAGPPAPKDRQILSVKSRPRPGPGEPVRSPSENRVEPPTPHHPSLPSGPRVTPVRGEPGQSPSAARVEPHSQQQPTLRTSPRRPHPFWRRAASETRPSSAPAPVHSPPTASPTEVCPGSCVATVLGWQVQEGHGGVPEDLVFAEGIAENEQLAHAGGEGHLGPLANERPPPIHRRGIGPSGRVAKLAITAGWLDVRDTMCKVANRNGRSFGGRDDRR